MLLLMQLLLPEEWSEDKPSRLSSHKEGSWAVDAKYELLLPTAAAACSLCVLEWECVLLLFGLLPHAK